MLGRPLHLLETDGAVPAVSKLERLWTPPRGPKSTPCSPNCSWPAMPSSPSADEYGNVIRNAGPGAAGLVEPCDAKAGPQALGSAPHRGELRDALPAQDDELALLSPHGRSSIGVSPHPSLDGSPRPDPPPKLAVKRGSLSSAPRWRRPSPHVLGDMTASGYMPGRTQPLASTMKARGASEVKNVVIAPSSRLQR